MSISKIPLGMNARNFLYVNRFNKARDKHRADDKLETKKILSEYNIPTAKIIHVFHARSSIKSYSWDLPQSGFVIKPARGFGGEGILVFKKWENGVGITVDGQTYNLKQIKSHILDIFDGIYSLQYFPDRAYIEEVIAPDPFFKKIVPLGLPDIRIIVFNKIPVMAMLRLPTWKSHGKANIHQGAVGVGIEMRTGVTNHGFFHNKHVKFLPGTKTKVAGIKVPRWEEILLLASRAQAVSGLGYAGIDIVVDRENGPVVIEVNARPGLSIQNVNLASLRERLERVEDLDVPTSERGVEIARSIFAEGFSHKVIPDIKVLSVIEPITILSGERARRYRAKLDTGAYRTSIDESVVTQMELRVLTRKFTTVSASGRQIRPAVALEFILGGKKISTIATVAPRAHLKFPIIIGRRDMKGFYVNPALAATYEKEAATEDREEGLEE